MGKCVLPSSDQGTQRTWFCSFAQPYSIPADLCVPSAQPNAQKTFQKAAHILYKIQALSAHNMDMRVPTQFLGLLLLWLPEKDGGPGNLLSSIAINVALQGSTLAM